MAFFAGLHLFQLIGLGFCVGVLGSLFGVGGGIIMVPALAIIAGLTQKQAQGVSLAVMVPMALMSFYRYSRMAETSVDLKMIMVLAVMAIIGANVGSTIVGSVSNRQLQAGFGIFIIAVGAFMVVKAFRGA